MKYIFQTENNSVTRIILSLLRDILDKDGNWRTSSTIYIEQYTSQIITRSSISLSSTTYYPLFSQPKLSFMDQLFSQINKAAGDGKDSSGEHHQKKSSGELLSSAKILAEAAQTAVGQGADKVDKGKAAGAASDLLEAGSKYGKLEEKSYGKYVDKAQDYLHQYETKNTTTGHGHAPSDAGQAPSSDKDHEAAAGGDHEKKQSEEGGVGGYLKVAQGFLHKWYVYIVYV